MNLQEASLPSSLMVSWLHFHPIVQLWTLLLRRRLVRLARLLGRPLFPFLGFPPFFRCRSWANFVRPLPSACQHLWFVLRGRTVFNRADLLAN